VRERTRTFDRTIGAISNPLTNHRIRLKLVYLPPAIGEDEGTDTASTTIPKFADIHHTIRKPKSPGTVERSRASGTGCQTSGLGDCGRTTQHRRSGNYKLKGQSSPGINAQNLQFDTQGSIT
jgi:hypothetical protein